jgi:CO/xanthine dehydrogenase FAD-binding subunit
MVRHVTVQNDLTINQFAPMLSQAAAAVGDVQVRNRGTIGGSICHADPSADYLPVLAVSNAKLVLSSLSGARTVSVDEFFVDVMFTTREPNELLSAVLMPKQDPDAGFAYVRFARVEGSFAIVNATAVVNGANNRARVALGGIAPVPVVMDVSQAVSRNSESGGLEEVARMAYEAADQATDDVHSDAEYRRQMAGVFAKRAVQAAVRASRGGEEL